MAIFKCVNCGNDYSDTLKACPHCGFAPIVGVCPECGNIAKLGVRSCVYCGFSLEGLNLQPADFPKIDAAYDDLIKQKESATKASEYLSLKNKFEIFNVNYKDAKEMAESCAAVWEEKTEEEKLENAYNALLNKQKDALEITELEQIVKEFESLGDYRDSRQLASEYREAFREKLYPLATEEEEKASNADDFKSAAEKYKKLGDYKDAPERLKSCGEKVSSLKKKTKKKIITAVSGAAAVLAITLLIIFVIAPSINYALGNSAFKKEDFSKAESRFLSAGDFKDAPERANESKLAGFYADGTKLLSEKKYKESAEKFINAGNYKDAKKKAIEAGKGLLSVKDYKSAEEAFSKLTDETGKKYKQYAAGMINLAGKKYSEAILCFSTAGGVEDSEERLKESFYQNGFVLLNKKDYGEARNAFTKAGDYKDAAEMINVCYVEEAEKHMKNGYLNSANEIYGKLPENYVYKNIKVADRRALLKKYSVFVKMCGKWRATDSKIATSEIPKTFGTSYEWSRDDINYNHYVDIKCVINSDGSVKIKGTADYTRCTNYSSIGAYIRSTKISVHINKDLKSAPNSTTIASGVTLTFTGDHFKLSYDYTDKNYDQFFNYRYTSTYTYGVRIKKY